MTPIKDDIAIWSLQAISESWDVPETSIHMEYTESLWSTKHYQELINYG